MSKKSTSRKTLGGMGLDMFDPQTIANPHAFYARLREEAPIIWSEQTQAVQALVRRRYEPRASQCE